MRRSSADQLLRRKISVLRVRFGVGYRVQRQTRVRLLTFTAVLSLTLPSCEDRPVREQADIADTTARSSSADTRPAELNNAAAETQRTWFGDALLVRAEAVGRAAGGSTGWSEQRIRILYTFAGHGATGDFLSVTGKDVVWRPDTEYVLVLDHPGIGELAPTTLVEQVQATAGVVEQVRAANVRVPGAVGPSYALCVRHEAGWGAGVLLDFRVTTEGQFRCQETVASDEDASARVANILIGSVPMDMVWALIQRISRAPSGQEAKDAGEVLFMWRDRSGFACGRRYTLPMADPCRKLTDEVKSLAARWGKVPTPQTAQPDKP